MREYLSPDEARRRKKIKRRRQVTFYYIVIVALLIVGVVFLVRKTVSLINGKDKDEFSLTEDISGITEDIKEDVEGVLGIGEDEAKEPEEPDYLGYNPTVNGDEVTVHGQKIYSGYDINKTDSTYYITSENMMSNYAILVDAVDGNAVCQKEGFTRINPASMTKILTALVAAEHMKEEDLDRTVTITVGQTDYAYTNDLSAVNFEIGEVVTVRDLFYGTILPSGADAALALAEYVSGDEETFVGLMNDKLKELGISDTTHFTNCVGLYDADHYSTCADMAVIIKAAIENDFVYDVMNAHTYTTTLTTEHPEGILISNWFLRRIEDKDTNGEVLCAKTGFVNESGSCAASYEVTKSGHPYICVTADAHSAWRCIYDHVDLYANCTE